jgi:site-specific recombinase XerD
LLKKKILQWGIFYDISGEFFLTITRATMLYQNGVELALISRILGHSQIETSRIYATPSMEMLREAMESIESQEQLNEKPLWESCSEDELARLCGLR